MFSWLHNKEEKKKYSHSDGPLPSLGPCSATIEYMLKEVEESTASSSSSTLTVSLCSPHYSAQKSPTASTLRHTAGIISQLSLNRQLGFRVNAVVLRVNWMCQPPFWACRDKCSGYVTNVANLLSCPCLYFHQHAPLLLLISFTCPLISLPSLLCFRTVNVLLTSGRIERYWLSWAID